MLELADREKIGSIGHYRRFLEDSGQPISVRLRAAVALKNLGDRRGHSLVEEQSRESARNEDRQYARNRLTDRRACQKVIHPAPVILLKAVLIPVTGPIRRAGGHEDVAVVS